MRRFRYMVDPLCLVCCTAYVSNRLILKPLFPVGFLHSYFNDVLLIPCGLPLMLWLQRQFGLRNHDRPPQVGEVLFHWLIWSLLFEVAGPHLVRRATGDCWDIVAYAVGAILATAWWKLWGQTKEAW